MSTATCIYCYYEVPAPDPEERPPDVSDNDAWDDLSVHHAKDCEWIQTRAHRLPQPAHTQGANTKGD